MEWAGRLMPKSNSSASRNQPHICAYILGLLLFSIFVIIYYGRDIQYPDFFLGQSSFSEPEPLPEPGKLPFALRATKGSCDLFKGKWVWDNITRPQYKEEECPYIDSQLSCLANGRPDNSYQFWRWQPDGCDLPSFNATLLLESIQGKRMLFAGDSLNRGQFFSMVCLVQSIVPKTESSLEQHDNFFTFQAKSYNATIDYYWTPFLLESNSDNILTHKAADRIVRKGSIDKHGEHWKGADIMIFSTYMWWLTGSDVKVLEGSFEDKPQHIEELSTDDAYSMGIKSMLKWVKENMDTKKTRVFFTSMAPFHVMSVQWGGKEGGNCYNETTMIADETYWGQDCRKSMMQVVKDELAKSEYPITLLNITRLSNYRKDAHPSIYKKQWRPLTPEQIANPSSYADCAHFCLPGLQDTWNELLFAKLFYP
ncbi:hypothetical protein QQ045_004864 [Rhodiola kirilowii]